MIALSYKSPARPTISNAINIRLGYQGKHTANTGRPYDVGAHGPHKYDRPNKDKQPSRSVRLRASMIPVAKLNEGQS